MAGDSESTTRQVLGLLDRLLLQNRSAAVLLAAYAAVAFKAWEQFAQPSSASPAARSLPASGLELLDPTVMEPLTRAAVLAHARGTRSAGGAPKGAPVMRRSTAPQGKGVSAQEAALPSEDPVALLERLLAPPTALAGEWPARVHLALGNFHHGRGEYQEAAEALSAAVRKAEAFSGSAEVLALGRLALGQLELRRCNHSSAEALFEAALASAGPPAAAAAPLAAAALAGAGWAALLAGEGRRAEGRLRAALGLAEGEEPQKLPQLCLARGDGLDGYRVASLAGLSLGRSLASGAEGGGNRTQAEAWRACASRLLLDAGPAAEAGGETPGPRLALGAAHLALGQVDAARRHFRRDLRRERSGEEPALYLRLASLASGNSTLAASLLARRLEAAEPEPQ